jgi:hypothetical protein
LAVTAAATPGIYTITVTASGSGISNATATFSLTIAAATSSSYTESLSAVALSIAPGATGNATVTYGRTNFTGSITPSVDNLPTGVTAAFSVNPVTGTSSVLTLTVGSTVTAGVYNMDVRGSASGLTDVTTPLTLTVTATAGSYTMALSGSTQSIAQGGSANTTVTLTRTNFTGNVYHFTVASGKGGFAAVTLSGAVYTTTINYFSQAELTANTAACTNTTTGNTVTGTVTNPPATGTVTISLGSASTALTPQHNTYVLSNVASGTQTLVAYKGTPNAPSATDAVFVHPGIVVPGTPVVNIDFSTAMTVQSAPFTVTGGTTGDTFIQSMAYLTTSACVANSLYSTFGTYSGAATTQYGVPVALQSPGEFHRFTAEDAAGAGSTTRLITMTFRTFATEMIVLPAALPAGTITTLSGGIGVRRQIAFTLPSDYSAVGFSYADAATNTTSIFASALYLGGSAVTLGMPDFTTAGGYLAIYGPGAGTLTTTVLGSGVSGAACTDGATTKVAIQTGTTN